MDETESRRTGADRSASLRSRLIEARWPIVGSAVVIATIAFASAAPWWIALGGFAGLCMAVLLAPVPSARRPVEDTRTTREERPEFETLTALDLAAVVPDPLLVFNENGATLYANAAAIAAFGQMPRGTLLPHRFRAPEMQSYIAAAIAGERVGSIEYAERVPLERSFRVSAMPIGDRGRMFAILFRDQSEIRRIDRMRADFIANASHELRTPLASIAGFIETLQGPARNDEKARANFLQIMQSQTARMARLIDDLLTLSRIEMKPLARPGERLDLGKTIATVVEQLAQVARENGVTVNFERPDQPVIVPGSRDELTQVFINLLENAYKYGSQGDRVDVAIQPSPPGQPPEVAITVRDFGPGIAEEHIPRITERFYRVEIDGNPQKRGTGLGLSIVKHILARHEGRLSIRSKLGEGSSFTVHLPAPPADE